MSRPDSQEWFVPSGATLQLPPRMRLAADERERLWKGLERFVNCGDSVEELQALSRSPFAHFWPVGIDYFPNQETAKPFTSPVLGAQMAFPEPIQNIKRRMSDWELARKIEGLSDEERDRLSQSESLNWHPVCHKLFIFYRDMLKLVWRGAQKSTGWLVHGEPEFLLGISDWNEGAHKDAQKRRSSIPVYSGYPQEIYDAWEQILDQFPTAWPESPRRFRLIWDRGDFELVPGNDFQRAFFLLFRQSWRSRICPRCKMFFIARRPKQIFCGTVCSAGSRLASKRKWWARIGAKRRAGSGTLSRAGSKERKRR